jgi:hypothetical protein
MVNFTPCPFYSQVPTEQEGVWATEIGRAHV